MAHEQPTSAPTSTSIGTAARAETETRGVGTMWSVGQPRKGISRRGEHPRLACPGVVQPPRWWISGNTDTVWLGLEGGCRPTFFHGLTERLLPQLPEGAIGIPLVMVDLMGGRVYTNHL